LSCPTAADADVDCSVVGLEAAPANPVDVMVVRKFGAFMATYSIISASERVLSIGWSLL
jgi:hypothetical protein